MSLITNIAAINSSRICHITNNKVSRSLEKLSSGLKINRAADDASGLSISEKMRSQIRGLSIAQENIQDGIGLLQTGDSGMNEVHALLQRVNELSVQAANGISSEEERTALQEEAIRCLEEIDTIAQNTTFNTIKMLNGSKDKLSNSSNLGLETSIELDLNLTIPNHLTLPSIFGQDLTLDYNSTGNKVQVFGTHDGIEVGKVEKEFLNAFGWSNIFGGTNNESLASIERTKDGGYLLVGSSNSNDGDVNDKTIQTDWDINTTPDHGTLQEHPKTNTTETWVVKLDSAGNIQWNTCIGSDDHQNLGYKGVELANGSYAILSRIGTEANQNHEIQYTVLDKDGQFIANNTLRLPPTDRLNTSSPQDLIPTQNGFILIANKRSANVNEHDTFIIEIDFQGNQKRIKQLPGDLNRHDVTYGIQQTVDGSYIVVGQSETASNAMTGTTHQGGADIWVMKLDQNFNVLKSDLYGTDGNESASSVQITPDGGYIVVGNIAKGNQGDFSSVAGKGGTDIFALRFDRSGNLLWRNIYGGSGNDTVGKIVVNPDGTYGLISTTTSNDGDIKSGNHGGTDGWILNIDLNGTIVSEKTMGGTGNDSLKSLTTGENGSYIFGGITDSADGDINKPLHGGNDIWVGAFTGFGDLTIELPLDQNIIETEIDGIIYQIVFDQCTSIVTGDGSKVKKLLLKAHLVDKEGEKENKIEIILQVGPNKNNLLGIQKADMRIKSLIPPPDEINLLTQENASSSLTLLKTALGKVSQERSKFGSYQNALDHIYSNVNNYAENLQTAESRIRDTDIPKEMMNLVKDNLILQSAQSMLAQAKNQPQSILQLLK